MTIGLAMSGARKSGRNENDYYPTEERDAILCLVPILKAHAPDLGIWEPACGKGDISKVLIEYGYEVTSTDLIGYGFAEGGNDFLLAKECLAPVIVTNPPFSLAEDFVKQAFRLGVKQVFMLLKAQYFHADGRVGLFYGQPLRAVMPMTFRPDFTGQGSPTMDCAWFWWDSQWKGAPQYGPLLRRPAEGACPDTIDLFENL